jgi:hypothetical protein
MAKLDALVINNVKERLLTPRRLTEILQALIERQTKDLAVQGRCSALEAEVVTKNDKLNRLYRAIEDGIVELDNNLKERIRTLKSERVLNLRWDEFDRERGMLLLPDSKTGRKPVILSSAAIAVLEGIPRAGDYVISGLRPEKARREK